MQACTVFHRHDPVAKSPSPLFLCARAWVVAHRSPMLKTSCMAPASASIMGHAKLRRSSFCSVARLELAQPASLLRTVVGMTPLRSRRQLRVAAASAAG